VSKYRAADPLRGGAATCGAATALVVVPLFLIVIHFI